MAFHRKSACIPRRRAVILLVVLAMLTLFAILGVTFVLYANAQSESARSYREAETFTLWQPDVPTSLLRPYFLNQLLYDVKDDEYGAFSALRGQGLLRGMYGLNYDLSPNNGIDLENNCVPYSGTGRLHGPAVFAANPVAPAEAQDDYNLINYTYYPGDGFIRDPERPGVRSDLSATRQPFWGGYNAPYTYPDLNNLFLAAVKADGTVLAPSFHRPWAGFGSLDPSNPNWTDATKPWLKYLVLRPRPADNPPINGRPGFPLPADAGGDVKNLMDSPGGNDSIWLDLNFPVQTAADGRKFKPLFAPLVVDLDGRVNVNLHGNMRGGNGAHVSNQGWGPWEVGLNRVLNADPLEWQNLIRGVRDPASLPGAATFGPTPPFYSLVDFDGCQAGGAASGALLLPATGDGFPNFPIGYDNANLLERTNHSALYGGQRFALSDLTALLMPGGTPGGLNASCPVNFADPRIRRLVTTQSYDPDWPGVTPWANGGPLYGHTVRGPSYPKTPERLDGGGPKAFPTGAGGEFTPDGRAVDAGLGRIDLTRPLPDYPLPTAGGQIVDLPSFLAAQTARQQLACDLFVRFITAVGAHDPASSTPPSDPEVRTLRWLAQLAVNMVDYIDDDDYSTPFNWGRAVGSPAFAAQFGNQWVFGTELPHVVLNEAYAECVNLPTETGPDDQATTYQVNVWVELRNPFQATAPHHGGARLNGSYQIALTQTNKHLLGYGDAGNVLGDPDNTGSAQAYDPNQVYTSFTTFNSTVLPAQGFYVAGPPAPSPGQSAWEPGPSFSARRLAGLTYQTPVAPGQSTPPPAPTVLLRRLACPALPYQPDPSLDSAAHPYNPFVTVDYMDNVHLNNALSNTGAGYLDDPPPVESRFSVGRGQPYDGAAIRTLAQTPVSAQPGQPQQTFGGPNSSAADPTPPPADWLVHLDRPPVSPMELLHVSCCKPHQLTHLFKDGTGDDYQSFNYAPYWLLRDANSPLYRIFEFLETHSRVAGVAPGDRIPGRINLNTIWDPETFAALCDAQPSNYFDQNDIQQIYAWMTAGRTPGGAPGSSDRPFKGLGAAAFLPSGAEYADGGGIDDTILRGNPSHPLYDATNRPIRLFEIVKKNLVNGVIQDHPYQRYELLNKIYGQLTTRSNVFAVWVTVGFFEVNDDASMPVKLGAEIQGPNGPPLRHHFFAIVDRSDLPRVFPVVGQSPVTSATPVPTAGPAVVAPTQMGGVCPAYQWNIRPGAVLQITGPDATGALATEQVVVTATTATTFTAVFSRAYPSGFTSIIGRGNPGPGMTLSDPGHDPALTPYIRGID